MAVRGPWNVDGRLYNIKTTNYNHYNFMSKDFETKLNLENEIIPDGGDSVRINVRTSASFHSRCVEAFLGLLHHAPYWDALENSAKEIKLTYRSYGYTIESCPGGQVTEVAFRSRTRPSPYFAKYRSIIKHFARPCVYSEILPKSSTFVA